MAGVDPISLAIIGAVGGGIMNKEDPLKGAIMGATLGFGGASLLGPAAAAGSAGTAAAGTAAGTAAGAAVPAGTSTYASLVPGLTSAAPGSQAAMLAGQTGQFGAAGLTATGSAAGGAAGVSPLTAGLWNAANSAMLPGPGGAMNAMRMAQMGGQMLPQNRNNVVTSAPAFRPGQAVNVSAPIQGLLTQTTAQRRRQPMSLLG